MNKQLQETCEELIEKIVELNPGERMPFVYRVTLDSVPIGASCEKRLSAFCEPMMYIIKRSDNKYVFRALPEQIEKSRKMLFDVCNHLGYKRIRSTLDKSIKLTYTQLVGVIDNFEYFLNKYSTNTYPDYFFSLSEEKCRAKAREIDLPYKITQLEESIFRIEEEYKTLEEKKKRLLELKNGYDNDYNDDGRES